MIRFFGLALILLLTASVGLPQRTNRQSNQDQSPLTRQNPPIVPDLVDFGKQVQSIADTNTRLNETIQKVNKIEERVGDISETVSWVRGAWWVMVVTVGVITMLVKFFGTSWFALFADRIEKARTKAASK